MNQKIHLLVALDPRTDGGLNSEILGRKYLTLAQTSLDLPILSPALKLVYV